MTQELSHFDCCAPPVAIDTVALLKRCMNNVTFASLLLVELDATSGALIDELARSAAVGDACGAAEAAHTLKGAAGIVAAEPLRALAAAAEAAGRADEFVRIPALVDDLRRESARCRIASARFRAQSANSAESEPFGRQEG